MSITIKDIAYYLPESVVTNQDLHQENPDWDIGLIEKRVGVKERCVAASTETAFDLAVKACEKIFIKHPQLKTDVDAIIFCTQSEDYIMPPNACLLHNALNLSEDVFAFDFNLACSGYVYGLAIARGLIQSGTAKNVLFVTADTYSKYIHKQDRSVRALFGDGAAVSWITNVDGTKGIVDIQCSTAGKYYDSFIIPAGSCRTPKSEQTSQLQKDGSGNVRTLENIHMDGMNILSFVNSKVPKQIKNLLSRNELKVEDIDLFIFHQASQLALESLTKILKINPEQSFQNLATVGNTVSASIPIALKDALDAGRIKPGDKVLLSGFGVGLSWGSAILEY